MAFADSSQEYIPVVVELFEKFSDYAKEEALSFLLGIDSRGAAEAYMKVVRSGATTGKLSSLRLGRLVYMPRHADVFFPELLKYANNPRLASDIYRLCLAYCEAGLLPYEKVAPFRRQFLEANDQLTAKLRPAQKEQGIDWMWEENYQQWREDAGVLLDLFGYLADEAFEKQLRDALEYKDPKLECFALVSLLRQGKAVDKKYVENVARFAEMRSWLYKTLKQFGKSSLFPEKYRTQKAFAEAEMVSWLVYPTELNRVPEEIELMKVVAIDAGLPDGTCDYYLFRFRTKEPHWAAKNGWMAGVAMAIPQKRPTDNGYSWQHL